ncbi:hypothetical protein SETIT_6G069000v2 [Setaria italica]|uniref:Uncharacterized protein n=1 Tax=Setaria italica TaxID=4555 RepID=A0A368RJ12_SETIT|nr:hypothetical protein SETIT_6G069000v2 [Setaria italica]
MTALVWHFHQADMSANHKHSFYAATSFAYIPGKEGYKQEDDHIVLMACSLLSKKTTLIWLYIHPIGNWEAFLVFVSALFFNYDEMAVRRSERPVLRLLPSFPDMTSHLSSRSGMVVA